ncbi:GNAT family N-acetyltransferase [Pelovirga terrestris]|uniref:GNAT family N-acetyltransferase n=1 Tax=Pelovirga terrestris TaxID=2771352 RepID=A0A8J6R4X8_9BACT|nr:GNAT family N-acetyltransferase [Pelovirga terrestris]MBD1399729.1 GNAT family N-acetyltransferase [Pelovirga terrestris]
MVLQPLSAADWNLFLRLARGEGWLVPTKEQLLFHHQWRPFFLALRHCGTTCGFISAVSYHHSGWIGNLLIAPELRGQGYGKYLFKEALKVLNQPPLQRIWLTASRQGRSLYQGYGFTQVDTVTRWSATGRGKNQPLTALATLACLMAIEQDCWGEDRGDLISALAADSFLLQQPNTLAMVQTGMDLWQLGPWSAAKSDPRSARLLLDLAVAATPVNKTLFVDALDSAGLELLLRQRGFTRHGQNLLMYQGKMPRLRGVMALASLGSIG